MGDRRVAYSIVVRKSEFQRPLGNPRNSWCDNIKMDLQEVLWGPGLDLSGSENIKVVGCCECVKELSGAINAKNFLSS
jgi:hypothetical protein